MAATSTDERARRRDLVEYLLGQGFAPPGVRGANGSALAEAERTDGIDYYSWYRREVRKKARGLEHFVPDWGKFVPPEPEPVVGADEHAATRAKRLSDMVRVLVTETKYPLINPEAIVIEPRIVTRYDRSVQDYVNYETTPRTWVTDTLMAEPIEDCRGRKFIFTSAQNDCQVHPIWENLVAYAKFLGAELVVGPLTYETQWWEENNPASRAYASEISDYLCFGQLRIGPNFVFCGEMNTIATASAPISDLTTYTRGRWGVFPHPKRQLKSVPSTDPTVQAHQVMTTGSCTIPKVIPRKAGVKSIFHQVAGAVVVEFDNEGRVFCRQITASDTGTFYDLDRRVGGGVVTTGWPSRALVVADLHARKADEKNLKGTIDLIEWLSPDYVVLHDVFDNESKSHHNSKDIDYLYEMATSGRSSVRDELLYTARVLGMIASSANNVVVVESNHDLGLDRWVREGRYRDGTEDTMLGLRLEIEMLKHAYDRGQLIDRRFSLIEKALDIVCTDEIGGLPDNVRWVEDGSTFVVDGIELGHHGFRGPNGSRGSAQSLSKTGAKMTIGHVHSPEICDGLYAAGVMSLRHGYNKGPSSWAVSHVVQYIDGNRAIITMQDGRWRA